MATTRSKRSSSPRRSTSEGDARRKTSKRRSTSEGAARRKTGKRRYGKAASKKVERALHEAKRGKLRSGGSKKKVTSRKQAIAIGLSQARKRGAKVPPRKRSRR